MSGPGQAPTGCRRELPRITLGAVFLRGQLLMSSDDQNPLISHDLAVETLRHAGVDAETISEALRDFAFPAPLSRVLRHLAHHGITRQSLIERMGDGP
jgi:hypothetical protein